MAGIHSREICGNIMTSDMMTVGTPDFWRTLGHIFFLQIWVKFQIHPSGVGTWRYHCIACSRAPWSSSSKWQWVRSDTRSPPPPDTRRSLVHQKQNVCVNPCGKKATTKARLNKLEWRSFLSDYSGRCCICCLECILISAINPLHCNMYIGAG